ncbi:hypothetical protein MPDQ_007047 [Monascus purpureus]|uniref:Uncharacterized protein n=1 Tax=Monascus purpureus TaxID=5098 RepID=A0A507R728_MONPU|nr:hypothetical protein MPDQ_007047 [Monascus purpureus]
MGYIRGNQTSLTFMDNIIRKLENLEQKIEDQACESRELRDQLGTLRVENRVVHEEGRELRDEVGALQVENQAISQNRKKLRFGALESRRALIRCLELYERDSAVVNSRNEVAHGGDIVGDIQAIELAKTYKPKYVAAYKEDFLKVYGIPYSEAARNVYHYPHQVIKAFDIRCSLMEMDKWDRHDMKTLKNKIHDLAQQIINDASDIGDVHQLKQKFEKGGSLLPVFEQMNIQYAKGGELLELPDGD